jgi:hypothetical protein
VLKFTFQDGSTLHVSESATVVTNVVGECQADAVEAGYYVRSGNGPLRRVDNIETV